MKIFLVTGAMGCIGAWTVYHLLKERHQVISFDISTQKHRLNLLVDEDEQQAIRFVKADLTDYEQVYEAITSNRVSHIIHLAALQIPFCRADPVLGAKVNVLGTVNVFEAAKQAGLRHLTYASSVAVYGPPSNYPPGLLTGDTPFDPHTLYGVYKQANESMARVYWRDHQISSTTLRPYAVYGVGRDQGLTSEPTKAMLAAAAGKSYHISFGGTVQFHWASDVARQFILAAEHTLEGAFGFNLGTKPRSLRAAADIIEQFKPGVRITVAPESLPFPEGFEATELKQHLPTVYETDLKSGIQQTITHFETLLRSGKLQL